MTARSFVVEVYAPCNRRDLADVVARARAAARAMTLEGTPVRYRRSIAIPEDETCFHVFDGPSAEAVDELSRRAALDHERIVEAMPLKATARSRPSPPRVSREIAELASLGLSNAEIAATLGLTAAVVDAELREGRHE